jgi:excinuclease ABC subunit C
MLVSLLDDVPGLGEARRKALMKQFGSLKRLRAASVEELTAVPGIGRRTAEAVLAAVAEPVPADAAPGRGDVVAAIVAEDAVELEEAPAGAVAPVLPVHGVAAGDTAEIGRVHPVVGTGA